MEHSGALSEMFLTLKDTEKQILGLCFQLPVKVLTSSLLLKLRFCSTYFMYGRVLKSETNTWLGVFVPFYLLSIETTTQLAPMMLK